MSLRFVADPDGGVPVPVEVRITLPISGDMGVLLARACKIYGREPHELLADVLDRVLSDDLFLAVLDVPETKSLPRSPVGRPPVAPKAPAHVSLSPKPKPAQAPAPRSPAVLPSSKPVIPKMPPVRPTQGPRPPMGDTLVDQHGVLITSAGTIQFQGKSMTTNYRVAALAAALVRAAPNPVDRQWLAQKLALPRSSAEVVISQLTTVLRNIVSPLGLGVNVVRGVGVAIIIPGLPA